MKIKRATLLSLLTLALAACGTRELVPPSDSAATRFDTVPVQIGQALAVTAAEKDLRITAQNADRLWVVSTLIRDPQMRPAFYANMVVRGQKPTDFWAAIAAATPDTAIYLTGAAKNRTFNGDVFPVELFQKLGQHCAGAECRLVTFGHSLYAVKGQNWSDTQGRAIQDEQVAWIKDTFAKVAQSVEKGDIPAQMAKRWERLLRESPNVDSSPVLAQNALREGTRLPVMHVGTQFYKTARANGEPLGAQTTSTNTCLSWFLWSCTVRKVEGELSTNKNYDFGNSQYIQGNMAWNPWPKQDYTNPLAAPYREATDSLWGDWDEPSPISRGLMIGSEYGPYGYVVGCGPMSVARLFDWARVSGRLAGPRVIRLPNDNLSASGTSVDLSQIGSSTSFMQMLFWPVKVGERTVNGTNRKIYAGWLSEKLNSTHYQGQTNTTTSNLMYGANSWLADNGWSERLTGAWSRDMGILSIGSMALPPAFNFASWAQATWGVNSVLKNSIGAGAANEMPAIVGYQVGTNGLVVNGIRLGPGHYALAKKFSVLEYWDWSENYAEVNWPDWRGDANYYSRTSRVYLSDYYDMLFAAYRINK